MFDTQHSVTAGLDSLGPGIILAAALDRIDVGTLSGHERIIVLKARQRMASHYAAQLMNDMVAVSDAVEEDWDEDPVDAARAAAAELRAALCLTRRAADSELGMALDIRRRLPRVWDALAAGVIDARRARAIAHATVHLDDDIARQVVKQVIEHAPRLTTGQIRARIQRLAIDTAPDEAQQRYDHAVEERRIWAEPTNDGTANLFGFDLPPDRVAAATNRINQLAQQLRGPGETRSIDQLRADVMLDLLDGSTLGDTVRRRGFVDIVVDLTTLAELDNHAGELAGYGPIVADIARRVAKEQLRAQWRIIVNDPDTGPPAYTGLIRRRPTAAQRRHVEIRNPRCLFPGCRMPAIRSDIDHRIPLAEGGTTQVQDLAPLCRHDHCIRHQAGWTYQFRPNGTIEWTTRLNHTYITSGTPP